LPEILTGVSVLKGFGFPPPHMHIQMSYGTASSGYGKNCEIGDWG
jgi:hypothetical protein